MKKQKEKKKQIVMNADQTHNLTRQITLTVSEAN